ncbi:membrane protease (metal dependent; CAAX family) [Chloroherpeton thalassium ATCC 35110]|uniref:Membrane protease (Metal dependent CAAX family) n=1 Tax=Chloroherpeton thalassium (strain ATCC 35110 / GB-78) TaxID=517418 RepID=B3QXH4_CHLT3|nr:CPBP family glutamic-type intramembrane protease [Chloroherpeton thalassium]ACF13448.1 membrane protease (metal dependent; CAAX family) [Chloroherpeton thalassium ATCC 35110]
MKKILGYLKKHISEDFNLGFYLFTAVFLASAFWINYTFKFRREVIDSAATEWLKLLYYALFFAFPYYVTSVAYAFFYRKWDFLKSRAFWGVSGFMIFVLTLNRSTISMSDVILEAVSIPQEVSQLAWLILLYILRIATMLLPLIIFKLIWDRSRTDFYGLTTKNFDATPYLLMLLLMLPLILWASFQPAFLKTYPRYKPSAAEVFLQLPYTATMLIFQIFYALRFVMVELFFRGFAVMAMPAAMGRGVIMPMVVLYAFWHFGKPMGEALGSIFGSYILGILALESGSVLGGVFVHMGIALLMDWAAYLQVTYFK